MFEKIKIEILKYFRGSLNYKEMSTKLGYSYNQYFKFESGDKKFMLQDFIKVCEADERTDLKLIFSKYLDFEISELNSKNIVRGFCSKWGTPADYVIEDYLSMSQSKWWRIYNGKSDISFVEFLELVEVSSVILEEFVSQFLTQEQRAEVFNERNPTTDFLVQHPEASLIVTGIYLQQYMKAKEEDRLSTLSEITHIELSKLNDLVRDMVAKKVLYYDENNLLKDYVYKVQIRNRNFLLRKKLSDFVLQEGLAIPTKITVDETTYEKHVKYGSFKIVPLCEDSWSELRKEVDLFRAKVEEIVSSSNPEALNRLVMLNQLLIDY